MAIETFFLKDIRSEDYRGILSPEEQTSLDRYLEEMKQGPGDGEMDIAWQESGQGYYVHLHQFESIDDKQERSEYLQLLEEDIKLWLAEYPQNYMVGNVRDILGRRG